MCYDLSPNYMDMTVQEVTARSEHFNKLSENEKNVIYKSVVIPAPNLMDMTASEREEYFNRKDV